MYSTCRNLIFVFVIFLTFSANANGLDSLRIEKVNGHKFIIHRVDPKETLYSISKRYGTTIDELYEYNESLENGLKMYDELLIPIHKKHKKEIAKPTTSIENIHIVAQGETLYSLSRKYGMSVDSLKSMNQIENGVLSIGDTLLLAPLPKKTQPEKIVSKEPDNSNKEETTQVPDKKPYKMTFHSVVPSETLFSISKQYNVSLEQLVEWNELSSYNLEIGQMLIVGKANQAKEDPTTGSTDSTSVTPVVIEKIKPKPTIDTTYVKTDNTVFKKQVVKKEGKTEVIEQGFAMRIDDTDFTQKLLALHKTAPMGSLVTVKSQMTGIEIQVRVVGTLPNTGLNRNVLLRLSSVAYAKLGSLDMKVPITSTYVQN